MMKMDKKHLVKDYILDNNVSVSEQVERFEIAWDVYKCFESVLGEISIERVVYPLKSKLNSYLPNNFEVSSFDYGSLYITKPAWKESDGDRGIIAVAFERWFRDWTTVGIVKNRDFYLDNEVEIRNLLSEKGLRTSNKWWLGYLLPLPANISLPLFDYYVRIIENPDVIVDEYFESLRKVCEIVFKPEVLAALDEFVKERKFQLFGDKQNF